ncbi:MAG: UPF0175 family protein [Candidatus Micrarchaeota archaeon]
MGELIAFRLSDDVGKELRRLSREEGSDRSALLRELIDLGLQEKRVEKAVGRYRNARVSAGRAAQEAGVSLWRWLEILEERGVESHYGRRDLEADVVAAKRG